MKAITKDGWIYLVVGTHKLKLDFPAAMKLRSCIDDALMDACDELDPEAETYQTNPKRS